MIPKEKAKELVKKYFDEVDKANPLEDILISAKRCALIAVNEIKESLKSNIEYPKIILLLDYTEIEVEDYE
jgi:hypothetical protein